MAVRVCAGGDRGRTMKLAAGLVVDLKAVVARLDLGLGTLEESFRRWETRQTQGVHLAHPDIEFGLKFSLVIESADAPCLAKAILQDLELVRLLGDEVKADVKIEGFVDGRRHAGEYGARGG